MSYENPPQREDINITDEHPLKEFLVLLGGITGIVIAAVFILAMLAQWLAPKIPFAVEQRLASQLDVVTMLSTGEPLATDDPRQLHVEQLIHDLAAHMSLPSEMTLQVKVVEDDVVNAFAALGGQIVVFTGLLDRMPHENALALVLAHEIGHVRERHAIVALGRGLTVTVAIASIFGVTDNGAVGQLVQWIGGASVLSFSRDQERDSDVLASQALLKYYGHLNGAADLFRALRDEDETAQDRKAPVLDFLNTHPGTNERIAYIQSISVQHASDTQVTALPADWVN